MTALADAKHVRPLIFVDAELDCVSEDDASGVTAYREQLKPILGDHQVTNLPHEQIIHAVHEASQAFRVLIVKTDMTIPYTSVFLQLDCRYWSAEAEQRLRAKMADLP